MDFDIYKDLNTTIELHEDLINAYDFRELGKELRQDKDAGVIMTAPALILNKLIPLIAEEDPYLIDKTLYEYNRFTFNTKLYITAYYNPADFNILRHSILNKGIEIRANTIGSMFLLNTIVKGSIKLEDVEFLDPTSIKISNDSRCYIYLPKTLIRISDDALTFGDKINYFYEETVESYNEVLSFNNFIDHLADPEKQYARNVFKVQCTDGVWLAKDYI